MSYTSIQKWSPPMPQKACLSLFLQGLHRFKLCLLPSAFNEESADIATGWQNLMRDYKNCGCSKL